MTKAKETKAKKTKVPARTRLNALASMLRRVLRRQTIDIIEVGKILLRIQDELDHGEWLPWLAKNFDLSERTAQRYIAAAEYADGKSDTVADFANLAPGILYSLANGFYDDKQEAAILAATREGRVPLATFADTKHSADDLEGLKRFLGNVITHKRSTSTHALTHWH